jgi:hypothetical protein
VNMITTTRCASHPRPASAAIPVVVAYYHRYSCTHAVPPRMT